MNFNNWTYRRKNRALFVIMIALLILSWFLAFGKTYRLIREYNKTEDNLQDNPWIYSNKKGVSDKVGLQDSLLYLYTVDSSEWTVGLLSNLSDVINNEKVRVNFENQNIRSTSMVVEREVTVIGKYPELERSLRDIEDIFFIKSLRMYVEKDELKCLVRMVAVKKTNE